MKKIPLWKNVILIFSVLFVVIIATLAWFYRGPRATLGTLDTQIGNARYIQVSGNEGDNWSAELESEIGVNKNFKEISGDGSLFFAPVYEDVENERGGYSKELVSFESANGTKLYYEQTFKLRSDGVQDVYLAPESFVSAVSPRNGSYIDGAIRVAFFELDEAGNETLKFIWAPNSTVEYSASDNSFNRNGAVEPYYYYQKSLNAVDLTDLTESNDDVAMISTENTDENGCGYNEEYKFMWSNGEHLPADLPSVVTMDVQSDDDLYYKTVKVKVWLEGYDRECVSLLNGQKFTMKLKFTAEEVE